MAMRWPASRLAEAVRHLQQANTSLTLHHLHPAASAAVDGLAALPQSSPASLQLALLNTHGVALHLLGEVDGAHATLTQALDIALGIGRTGGADDDFVGLGGVLCDMAANHIRCGQADDAAAALKRSRYMLLRAYRRSESARACLLSCTGLLHEMTGDMEAALAAHEEAHAVLCSPRAADGLPPRRVASWTQSARAGVIGCSLRLHRTRAADVLASAGVCKTRLEALCPIERGFARSLASISTLQRRAAPRDATEDAEAEAAGEAAEAETALAALRAVADSLASLMGPEHDQAKVARGNVAAAEAVLADGTALTGGWERHWQPALGAGIAAALRPPRPSYASTTQGDAHRWG